jgi:hypothetical protein
VIVKVDQDRQQESSSYNSLYIRPPDCTTRITAGTAVYAARFPLSQIGSSRMPSNLHSFERLHLLRTRDISIPYQNTSDSRWFSGSFPQQYNGRKMKACLISHRGLWPSREVDARANCTDHSRLHCSFFNGSSPFSSPPIRRVSFVLRLNQGCWGPV